MMEPVFAAEPARIVNCSGCGNCVIVAADYKI